LPYRFFPLIEVAKVVSDPTAVAWHIGEIHPVNACDRRRHREDRRPSGELAGDDALPLLLEQIARLDVRISRKPPTRVSTRRT
jgi:hypothetical protein